MFCQQYVTCHFSSMIRLSIDISVIIYYFRKTTKLQCCNLEYECIVHVGNNTQIRIRIGEGFVSKIHCHFRLSFNFCLTYSWLCNRCNSFMLTNIFLRVISDTVILICMSFISLEIFSNLAFCGNFFTFYKNVFKIL